MLEPIAEYLYRSDAEIARAQLDGAGIAAMVRADDEGGLNPGFFSEFRVVLLVNDHDAAAAREVLGVEPPLFIPTQIRRAMLDHSGWAYPNEACGLLAGAADRIAMVFCLTNRLASPTGYTIDPDEHYGAARYAEACGWDIVGAWHSHPAGDAGLSRTDIADSPGGSWVTVVVGNHAKRGEAIRAFRTRDDGVVELEIIERP